MTKKKTAPPPSMSADDILAKIPDVLDVYGWETGEFETLNGLCLTGAAALALGRKYVRSVTGMDLGEIYNDEGDTIRNDAIDGVHVDWLAYHDPEFFRAMVALATVIVQRRFATNHNMSVDMGRLYWIIENHDGDALLDIIIRFNDWHRRGRKDVVRVCELARKRLADDGS